MHIEFIERCTMTAFLDCHQRAFQCLGGILQEILYDNMKNVVVRRYVGRAQFNSTFLDFCAHAGYSPVACPPYSPWVKGKVERPIDYLRERFWRGYAYSDLPRVNRDVQEWNSTVAMERIHGTTQEQVRLRFEREQPSLGPLPRRPYDTSEQVYRTVAKDCQLAFGGNRYVVPHTLAGKVVLLTIKDGRLRVYDDETLAAEYAIPLGHRSAPGAAAVLRGLEVGSQPATEKVSDAVWESQSHPGTPHQWAAPRAGAAPTARGLRGAAGGGPCLSWCWSGSSRTWRDCA